MEKKELTKRQVEVFSFIKEKIAGDSYPPSIREIARQFKFRSPATVQQHLGAIMKKGYLARDKKSYRLLRLTPQSLPVRSTCLPSIRDRQAQTGGRMEEPVSTKFVQVPLIGWIAAGRPIEAIEEKQEIIPLPEVLIGLGDYFILQVKGDSMVDEGIVDGDLVVIRSQKTAQNGDVVVALIDGEATLKKFYKEKDGVRLQPANPALKPIFVKNVTIQGKAVAVIRRL